MVRRRRLRRPRIRRIKSAVPTKFKQPPKALQGKLLTAVAKGVRKHVDPAGTVLISSWPRSGSTWLFEMLASDRSLLPLFEPFHPTHNPHMQPYTDELGFLRPPTPTGSAAMAHLVNEIYVGRKLTRWSTNRSPRSRLLYADRTLLKEVRIGSALKWIVDLTPGITIVLIRHPGAVIESALRSPGEWLEWSKEDVISVMSGRVTLDPVDSLHDADRLEFLATLWAADVADALTAARSSRSVYVVTYEDLVQHPVNMLTRISEISGLDDIAASPTKLSLQTHSSSPLHQSSSKALHGWMDRLNNNDASRIIETVKHFGVEFYSTDALPDSERLIELVGESIICPGVPDER